MQYRAKEGDKAVMDHFSHMSGGFPGTFKLAHCPPSSADGQAPCKRICKRTTQHGTVSSTTG